MHALRCAIFCWFDSFFFVFFCAPAAGVFPLLDEQALLGQRGSDDALLSKLLQVQRAHPALGDARRLGPKQFAVK
jgi:hypothetical protein